MHTPLSEHAPTAGSPTDLTPLNKPSRFSSKYFSRSDPLTALVHNRLGWPIWLATLVFVLLLNLPLLVVTALSGALFDVGERTGLLNDIGWWIYQLTSVPATLAFLLWLPDGLNGVLEGLLRNRIITAGNRKAKPGGAEGGGSDELGEFIRRFDRWYSHPGWFALTVVVVASFMAIAVIPEHRLFMSWVTVTEVLFWYEIGFWFFLFVAGGLIFLRVLIAILWFNRLFREFRVDVRVLHPDGAGGLSPLGSFSVKVGYLIGVFGLAAVAAVWSHSAYLIMDGAAPGLRFEPATISLILAYIVVAPIVFFAPIGAAHAAMRSAKDEFLIKIADQFEADFSNLHTVIEGDSAALKAALEKIEQLQKIHHIVNSFPVWPFNSASLLRFFSSTLSPVVFALIPTLIELIFP